LGCGCGAASSHGEETSSEESHPVKVTAAMKRAGAEAIEAAFRSE
jgi:hypothetical protein